MADQEPRAIPESRNRPDLVLLVAGVLALLLAGSVVLGGKEGFWLGWALSAVAVFVGLVLLVISMRRR